MVGISVVIAVIKEEIPLLPSVLASIADLADEIILIDMTQDDSLQSIAEKYNAKIFEHKFVPYVEVVRNYGLSKARGEWVLILDPDEQLSKTLAARIKKIVQRPEADYYRIARKNIIFGKWMQHSGWWPDYNIRFFKRNAVVWDEAIHSVPITQGVGHDLKPKEELAIIHHNYQSIGQYLARMDRYTQVQARQLSQNPKYKFIWMDVIRYPAGEFFSRYFAQEGYKDGLHGLALSLLQTFSEIIKYLRVWEKEKFLEQAITPDEVSVEFGKTLGDFNWWISDMLVKNKNIIASLPHRIRKKVIRKK